MKKHTTLLIVAGVILLIRLPVAHAQQPPPSTGTELSDPVLVGAGDVASCDDLSGAYATAKLIKYPARSLFPAT